MQGRGEDSEAKRRRTGTTSGAPEVAEAPPPQVSDGLLSGASATSGVPAHTSSDTHENFGSDFFSGAWTSVVPEIDPDSIRSVEQSDRGYKAAGYVPGAYSNFQAREKLRKLSNAAAPTGYSRRLINKQPDPLADELEKHTFVGSKSKKDCDISTFADFTGNRKVVDDILSLYSSYPNKRRVLLALASVGIEYSCASLYQLCCGREILFEHSGVNYLEVRKLPDSIRVIDIYNDLLDVSAFLGSNVRKEEAKSRLGGPALRTRLYYNEAADFVNWRELGWGLFTFLSSLEGRCNNMKSEIVCRERMEIKKPPTPGAWIKYQKPLEVHNIGNCVVTSLIACVAAEIEDNLNVPLTSQCISKQDFTESEIAVRSKVRNSDKYGHVMALPLNVAEDDQVARGLGHGGLVSGGIAHDVFYFILLPLESRIEDMSDYPDALKCKQTYLANLRELHKNLTDQMLKRNFDISRGPLRNPPLPRAVRRSNARLDLKNNEDRLRVLRFNSSPRQDASRTVKHLKQSMFEIG